MPRTRDNDFPGFTTNYYNRCCVCRRELTPEFVDGHAKCECGVFIAKVRLQPKQDELARAVMATGPTVPTKLAFYGPRAAGKSRGLRDIALIAISENAHAHNGIPAFLLRRNWTQCQEGLLEKYKIERPYMWDCYNGAERQYTFPEAMGSPRIAFKYADTPDDVLRLERGPECFLLLADQAEQIPARDLQRITSPNRWPGTQAGAAKTVYFLNPGGVGSDYLRDKFVTKKFEDNEDPGDFFGVFAAGYDNFSWFEGMGIEINGEPLTWDLFYSLPADVPEPPDGKYSSQWLANIPDNNRFKLYVTRTSEGKKHWAKPEEIRIGDLFGSFSQFEGQYFLGAWDEKRVVLR